MLTPIIGRESRDDPQSICLCTKEGTYIPNERLKERHPDEMHAAIEIVQAATENVQCRSASGTYNCVGLVFASRRTKVEPRHLNQILFEDGFSRVDDRADVVAGDLVLYEREGLDEPAHVGQVVEIRIDIPTGTREIWVLSQFSRDGEFLHEEHDVPEGCGEPVSYFSERRVLDG